MATKDFVVFDGDSHGPAEILPPVGAKWKALRVSADPVAKPAAHTRAESWGS